MSELTALIKNVNPTQVDLLYWGSAVVGHEVYLPNQYATLATVTKPKDGGATRLTSVVEWLRKPEAKGVTGAIVSGRRL